MTDACQGDLDPEPTHSAGHTGSGYHQGKGLETLSFKFLLHQCVWLWEAQKVCLYLSEMGKNMLPHLT